MASATRSLRLRLFLAFALVTVMAALLPMLLSRDALYRDRLALAEEQAQAQAFFIKGILASGLAEAQVERLFTAAREQSFRLTLTDASGRVLRDSHIAAKDLPGLDNHADRPEIARALDTGTGISQRYSNSLGLEAIYAAVRMDDGGILRVALPFTDIARDMQREAVSLGAAIAGVAFFCLLLSLYFTERIRRGIGGMTEVVESISRDKGRRRLHSVPGSEFLPLARAVNLMADNIESYMHTTLDQHAQLENILDSMHEGVLVLGPTGAVRRWNKALETLFPCMPGATGKQLIEGLPVPQLQRRVEELLRREAAPGEALETQAPEAAGGEPRGGAPHEEALHFELPPGRFLVAHLSRPVEPSDSLGVIVVIYDATELMRLERVRRDFVANVSHELRTPLTSIMGYSETLMNLEDASAEQKHFSGVIYRNASSLAKIVSDLLELARIENAPQSIAVTPVDPRTSLEEAMAVCRAQAEQKALRFAVDMEDAFVNANGQLLTQVFRNLLENACRYSPEGGSVRVTAKKEGEQMLFIVADNGPGIPVEALPRIFERFYQVKKERNSATAGIGLAICKHIVERHGGRIWAESPHGDDATAILFTLPLAGGFAGTLPDTARI